MSAQVTILLPNYQTLKLTTLCLRLIRKHTDLSRIKVIAIDNGSKDASLDYLRSVDWINLIERHPAADEGTALSHSLALDAGLAQVTTPYVLSIHTDTLIKHPGWLDYLLSHIENNPKVAGVGSWKMESKPPVKQFFKTIEQIWQRFFYSLIGKKDHRVVGLDENYEYLRSHCALYRTAVLKEHSLTFADGIVAGKGMHKKCLDQGYKMIFLPTKTLSQYLNHINHATIILNPELGGRNRTIKKGLVRVKRELKQMNADAILQDTSLDHA